MNKMLDGCWWLHESRIPADDFVALLFGSPNRQYSGTTMLVVLSDFEAESVKQVDPHDVIAAFHHHEVKTWNAHVAVGDQNIRLAEDANVLSGLRL